MFTSDTAESQPNSISQHLTGHSGEYPHSTNHTLIFVPFTQNSVSRTLSGTLVSRSSLFVRMSLILGDVVRVAPNHISFASVQALEEIYGYNTKCNKSDFYSQVTRNGNLPP